MLCELPLEVIRRIRTNLSPESALCFAHSCQHTYQAFDDWTVWRTVVKGSARIGSGPRTTKTATYRRDNLDKMAGASVARHGDGLCNTTVIEKYAPQLMVFGCEYDGGFPCLT